MRRASKDDTVFFSGTCYVLECTEYFVKEGEGPVVIKILRQGDPNFETEISKYHSHALSLLCHLRFLFQSDWLLFFRGLCIIMIISCISMSL